MEKIVNVKDFVQFATDDPQVFYIGRVLDINGTLEERTERTECTIQWFYLASELPEEDLKTIPNRYKREIFLSNQTNSNPLGSIDSFCKVVPGDTYDEHNLKDSMNSVYVCNYRYDPESENPLKLLDKNVETDQIWSPYPFVKPEPPAGKTTTAPSSTTPTKTSTTSSLTTPTNALKNASSEVSAALTNGTTDSASKRKRSELSEEEKASNSSIKSRKVSKTDSTLAAIANSLPDPSDEETLRLIRSINVGDHVILASDDPDVSYIARVKSISCASKSSRTDTTAFIAQWFYQASDIPKWQLKQIKEKKIRNAPQEVYFSHFENENPMGAIFTKCLVVTPKQLETINKLKSQHKWKSTLPMFLSRYFYTPELKAQCFKSVSTFTNTDTEISLAIKAAEEERKKEIELLKEKGTDKLLMKATPIVTIDDDSPTKKSNRMTGPATKAKNSPSPKKKNTTPTKKKTPIKTKSKQKEKKNKRSEHGSDTESDDDKKSIVSRLFPSPVNSVPLYKINSMSSLTPTIPSPSPKSLVPASSPSLAKTPKEIEVEYLKSVHSLEMSDGYLITSKSSHSQHPKETCMILRRHYLTDTMTVQFLNGMVLHGESIDNYIGCLTTEVQLQYLIQAGGNLKQALSQCALAIENKQLDERKELIGKITTLFESRINVLQQQLEKNAS